MNVEIKYGKGRLNLALSAAMSVDMFEPAQAERESDLADFERAFHAAGGDRLLSGKPLLVVNDGHRSTPTATVLRWLDQTCPDLLDRAEFLIATGTHDAPTREHLERIFGEFYQRVADRVNHHLATDPSCMTRVGVDRFGGEVFVNRRLVESDNVCLISSVEPHYFAGFTGGRKSIFPGLTDLATIERNHNLANSLEAMPLRLEGNPVADHLQQMVSLIDTSHMLAVQLVVDAARKIAGVFCGSLEEAFASAVELSRRIYSHSVAIPYDAVLCEMVPPLDGNLYQAQKGLENCQAAVAEGGSAIVISACSGGIGSSHFYELADGWDREANQSSDGVVRFGSHKLSRVNAMGRRIDVRLYSQLEDDTVRHVFYEPLDDIPAYLEQRAQSKESYRLAVVRDAGHTVMTKQ